MIDKLHNKLILKAEAINILLEIKEKITGESDFTWTSFDDAAELRKEIDDLILRLQTNDRNIIKDIYIHFLPTSTFQEHSIQNSWSNRYMQLAEQFDEIYELCK